MTKYSEMVILTLLRRMKEDKNDFLLIIHQYVKQIKLGLIDK